jgi:hypothetical protein
MADAEADNQTTNQRLKTHWKMGNRKGSPVLRCDGSPGNREVCQPEGYSAPNSQLVELL